MQLHPIRKDILSFEPLWTVLFLCLKSEQEKNIIQIYRLNNLKQCESLSKIES